MTSDTENESTTRGDEVLPEGGEHDTDRTDALEQEVAELRAKWLRAQADYQNLRRRAASELEGGIRRRLQPLLEELLLVLDYLDLALAAQAEHPETRTLAMGVEMTRVKLLQALEAEEVHVIDADGEFDPERHDAADTRFVEGARPGSILEVVRKGYVWRDVVLRPAQVVVAAGPEGPAQAEGASEPMTEDPEVPEDRDED